MLLLESQPRVGRRLLATGNGRCNITNSNISVSDYYTDSPKTLRAVLDAVSDEAYEEFFCSVGIPFVTDSAGRVYPRAQSAAAVLDMLRLQLDVLGVTVECAAEASAIRRSGDGFVITAGEQRRARRVIIATGGIAGSFGGTTGGIKLLESLGHTSRPPRASLVPIKVSDPAMGALKGTRLQCRLSLERAGRAVDIQTGELQFNDGALSGIAIFNLSAKIEGKPSDYVIAADLMSDISAEQTLGLLRERRAIAGLTCEDFLLGLVSKRPAQCIMKRAGISPLSRPAKSLSDTELEAVASVMHRWEFPVTQTDALSKAQVMRGGVELSQFDEQLCSKKCRGVYACGEVLNCDGPCGGYNLRWAFSGGILAARSAAYSLGSNGVKK